ncbi:hypothetical protein [Thermaerobacillus caldiproteolyticus]|uniref:hypothetical protein n=1 Tax=Thermaerobacillus caldiproteolyticus TaxID=247480 RepID=UPI00188D3171|nr:hypothetical protein [Anoxybacillus caldiproteolyticus]QPA30769.1 hypothetical protein ISX45_14530 [Anoxybacillus caldiproteolyticus]
MLKNLPHGVKISIARSITRAFEKYMNDIEWEETKFHPPAFMQEWRSYIEKNSNWFHSLDEQIKSDPSFHEELANKINEMIEKVLSEAPTNEQLAKIETLAKELNLKDIHVSCKAEANYYIERLENMKRENK